MSYRYIGNKTRLLPHLLREIGALVPSGSRVADIMCGTGSVSEALRTTGYKVIASDLMTFSVHHARVRLLLRMAPKFKRLGGNADYAKVHQELQNLEPQKGLFFREYSPAGSPLNGQRPRMYFTPENASQIDAANSRIKEWYEAGEISKVENSLLRHDLILAANRVANIAGTYGHFRSKWCNGSTAPFKFSQSEFAKWYSTNHLVMQGPAEEVASRVDADLCYLDPPYMKRQYAANYHIIETLARGDEPDAIGASGLRPWRDQYSNFCSKIKIRDSFRSIFSKATCKHFLISYSEDGLLGKEELIALFSEFGRVSLGIIPFKRFKSNPGGSGGVVREFLFHIRT